MVSGVFNCRLAAYDISGKDCQMSVTRDPAANKMIMEKPLQLVCNKDGKLLLNPEALKVLQSIKDPMVVVAVVGAVRTGKSYLMNCLAGDKNGFSVDANIQSHTKGIWMWCRSLPERPNEVLLLLDTEGLGDPEKGDKHNDNSIYSLAILLSSILIYNGQKCIDLKSLQELHFVTELSKQLLMKSQPDGYNSWIYVRFLPEFVWVIRDMTLEMNIDGKAMTLNEYLEHNLKLKDSEISEQDKEYNELRRCIRNHFPSRCCFAFPIPTFRSKLKQLQELEDKDLGFVELTKAYMGMMADGVLPCVESCVAKLVEMENQAAVDEALKFYENVMKNISESCCPTMWKLIENHNARSIDAFNIFNKRSMNNNSGKYIRQLEEKMNSTYKSLMAKIKKKSEEQCRAHLAKEMSSIKENLSSGHYQSPGGFQKLNVELDKAIKQYEEKTKNEMEGLAVLTHFLEEEKLRLEHIQEVDSRLTEEQVHFSALEEELSRVKCEMKKMEQERKAAEEHRNKEIKEQLKKRCEEDKECIMEELKKAMEHTRSEIKTYKVEGRMEDAKRAQQMYDYLEKKYKEASEWQFLKFIAAEFRLWMEITG